MRIFSVFLFLIAVGCSKKEAVSQKEALNLAFNSPVMTLDPRVAVDPPGCHVVRMLFEGLTRQAEQGNAVLAVAEKHTVSEDLNTHTFTLKETFWTDGMPVTAYDFEYAWKKSIDPKTLGRVAQNFYCIKNAQLCAQGKVPLSDVGIRAVDAYTLEIELEHPVPYLLDLLETSPFYPIPKHLAEIDSSWMHRTDQTFVSNGPFKLKKWKRSEEVTVEKNLSYWDQQHVYLPEIRMSFIEDGMTQFYMYEKNQLDWIGIPINDIPQEALEALRKRKDFCSVDSPRTILYFFNTEAFPFNNKKLRQAFSYALDRNEIVDHILDGSVTAAYGIIPPFFGLEQSDCFEDRKFNEAKRLFNEALIEEGLTLETFPSVTISYANNAQILAPISQIVRQVWQQTFGIKVTLYSADWPVHFSALLKGSYEIGMSRWQYGIDPIYTLQSFQHKDNTINFTNWESQEYIDLLDASNHETDPEKRKCLLIAAEKVMMDEMPLIPLYHSRLEFSKNPRFTGVVFPKGGYVDFKIARFSH